MTKDIKRLFLGFEIFTHWPELPKEKKMIDEENRHITLLFLGDNSISSIKSYMDNLPQLDLKVGAVGFFEKCLFWPIKHPRLVAYGIDFFENNNLMEKFQKDLVEFFKSKNHQIREKNNFLPHVTICRDHFDVTKWQRNFRPFPLYIKSFNLYESLGHSEYKTLWKKDYIRPFDEIPHTADIAFTIKGESYNELLYNSFIALSFKSFDFFDYYSELRSIKNVDDIIIKLNDIITKAEIKGLSMPFKAVSFNSHIEKKDDIFSWEMIVDV